jgi:adenylate cyclase
MESTDPVGRIQVPQNVYERLRHEFVLEERGEVDVKGKGVMRTWFLVDRKPAHQPPVNGEPALEHLSGTPAESRIG